MTRRRVTGWVLFAASVVAGSLAWFTAWGTFEPGFGFESLTVTAALIGTACVIGLLIASVLLGLPVFLLLLCLPAALVMAVAAYGLTEDIPGAPDGSYRGDSELYTSRLQALWLAGLSIAMLLGVVVAALWDRTRSSRTVPGGLHREHRRQPPHHGRP